MKKVPFIYNVICFGFLPWSNMWKRNQSIMAELSKSDFINKVIFVNPRVSIKRYFPGRNTNTFAVKSVNSFLPVKINSKITVYSPYSFFPGKKYIHLLSRLEESITLLAVRKLNAGEPYILFMNCPNIFSCYVLDELLQKTELSVFDLSDDFVKLGYNKETLKYYEHTINRYVKKADIVLTSNSHVMNKYRYLNKNIHILRNATNYYNFDRKQYKTVEIMERIKNKKNPIIGYSGIANMSRIDSNILDYLIDQRPNWQFVFIGPAKPDFAAKYEQKGNVHNLPPVDYQMLPDYLNYFDAAIVPFEINEHTKGNDLLKLNDYLAMGKPVVSTEIGGASDLNGVIRIAEGKEEFLNALEEVLNQDSPENVEKLKNIASANSWHIRIKELEELIYSKINV